MNDSNKMMEFTSKKYNDDELKEMGVVARRSLVCRKIDFNNPHFLNYHSVFHEFHQVIFSGLKNSKYAF